VKRDSRFGTERGKKPPRKEERDGKKTNAEWIIYSGRPLLEREFDRKTTATTDWEGNKSRAGLRTGRKIGIPGQKREEGRQSKEAKKTTRLRGED